MDFGKRAEFRKKHDKVHDLVVPEEELIGNLNSRLGLDAETEERILTAAEIAEVYSAREVRTIRAKAEQIIYLLTLFPDQRERILKNSFLLKLREALVETRRLVPGYYRTRAAESAILEIPLMHVLAQLTGEAQTVDTKIREQLKASVKPIQIAGSWGESEFPGILENVVLQKTLLPNEPHPLHPKVEEWLHGVDGRDLDGMNETDAIKLCYTLMRYNPESHKWLHTYFMERLEGFGFLAKGLKEEEGIAGATNLSYFATMKLMMAEEIQVGPTGILTAVENKKLASHRPLPARAA